MLLAGGVDRHAKHRVGQRRGNDTFDFDGTALGHIDVSISATAPTATPLIRCPIPPKAGWGTGDGLPAFTTIHGIPSSVPHPSPYGLKDGAPSP